MKYFILALAGSLTLALMPADASAQGSDACASAQAISGLGAFAFDNSLATTDGLPDGLCDFAGQQQIDNDVWFAWTAPSDGIFTLDTCGQTSIDSKIAVYAGTCTGTILACNDDACASLQSSADFPAVGGNIYILRVGTYPGSAGGTGNFTLSENVPVLNPANGNYYLAVSAPGLTWTASRPAAEAHSFMGVQGHMATALDVAENNFIYNNLTDPATGGSVQEFWLGGFQDLTAPDYAEPAGGWYWVTGESMTTTAWASGEPNDTPAPEDFMIYMPDGLAPGLWNDGKDDHWNIRGYIVEFDTGTGLGTRYCNANVNSTGEAAAIYAAGSALVSDANLTLSSRPVPNQPGIFFYAHNQIEVPFGHGFLCVSGGIARLPVIVGSGNEATFTLDWSSLPATGQINPGETWNFQFWYRDPAAGLPAFNTSDAMEITFGA